MSFTTRSFCALLPALAVLLLALLNLGGPASAHGFKIGALEIGHPWARETPPSATTGAGYLTVKNTGTEADRLIAVETPGAKKAEIHQSIDENGVAKMRPVPGIEIPAGGSIELKSGGYHLMLIGLKESLAEGMRVPGTLTFEKSGKVDIEFAVEPMSYQGPGQKHGDAPKAEEHKH